jgi:hypothetical protein
MLAAYAELVEVASRAGVTGVGPLSCRTGKDPDAADIRRITEVIKQVRQIQAGEPRDTADPPPAVSQG